MSSALPPPSSITHPSPCQPKPKPPSHACRTASVATHTMLVLSKAGATGGAEILRVCYLS